ncbi:hypothetical protein Lal_00008640, partial [Lupinus albus]
GRRERTGPSRGAGLFQPLNPSSGQTDFRRTLPGAPAVVSTFSCVAAQNPHPGAGILTGFPSPDGAKCTFETELPYGLGSTNPCPTAVHMEPFPTSVLQVLIEVFATTTKICTRGRSTRAHALGFVTDLHVRLLLRASFLP